MRERTTATQRSSLNEIKLDEIDDNDVFTGREVKRLLARARGRLEREQWLDLPAAGDEEDGTVLAWCDAATRNL